jgi:diguanylate cyclase
VRNLAIILALIYGGLLSSIVAAVVISIIRLAVFGVSIYSLTAIATFFILILLCWVIKVNVKKPIVRFTLMNIVNVVISYFALDFVLEDKEVVMHVFTHYAVTMLLGGVLVHYVCEYTINSNRTYLRLKDAAEKDYLTGLYNVRQFNLFLAESTEVAKQKEEKLSIILLDIDHFKSINDTYGHNSGDIVLRNIGRVIQKSSRSFDIVSRNGGEEFSIILPDCSSKQALSIAERIRKSIEAEIFVLADKTELRVTVSIGIATYPERTDNTEGLLEEADVNLYRAKNLGRNRVSFGGDDE